MKNKFLLATLILLFGCLFTFSAKPSYAYWQVFGLDIPTTGEEIKTIFITKILKLNNESKGQMWPGNKLNKNEEEGSKGNSSSEAASDDDLQNKEADDGKLEYIDLTEKQINTIVYNFVTDKDLDGNFKVNDLKINLLDDSIEFEVELNNGVSLNGKVATADSGQSLKLVEINNTGSKSFFGLETVFVQTIFNKYANKESIAELAGNQYVDKFSHLEISPESLRVWFKNE